MRKGFLFGLIGVLVLSSAVWAVLGGGEIVMPVQGAKNVLYSHDAHVGKAKIGCKECHYKVYINRANHKSVTMEDMRKGKSCGLCHDGTRAFSVAQEQHCARCHNREKQ